MGERRRWPICLAGSSRRAPRRSTPVRQLTWSFPTFARGTAQSTLDRYNYKSYAIFEDNAANPGSVKQVTALESAANRSGAARGRNRCLSQPGRSSQPELRRRPSALRPTPGTTPAFRCLKFNSNGEVEAPAANVLLGVFEGYVSNGTEVVTSKDASGNPAAVEYIVVAQFTGRAEPTGGNANTNEAIP